MNDSFTGVEQQADTTITITIEEVRAINKKLIERKYLLNIVNEQDSIIKYQDNYIKEEQRIVRELQDNINNNERLHVELNKSVNKYKLISGCLGASLAISLLFMIFK